VSVESTVDCSKVPFKYQLLTHWLSHSGSAAQRLCEWTSSITGCHTAAAQRLCEWTSSITGCHAAAAQRLCEWTSSITGCHTAAAQRSVCVNGHPASQQSSSHKYCTLCSEKNTPFRFLVTTLLLTSGLYCCWQRIFKKNTNYFYDVGISKKTECKKICKKTQV